MMLLSKDTLNHQEQNQEESSETDCERVSNRQLAFSVSIKPKVFSPERKSFPLVVLVDHEVQHVTDLHLCPNHIVLTIFVILGNLCCCPTCFARTAE